jgi:hypothetical protein
MNTPSEKALIYSMLGLAIYIFAVGVVVINQEDWNISGQVIGLLLAVGSFGGLIFGFLWERRS